ncbi:hypothetical protein [Crocosphaera chwakensis]|uniref:Uncharacterized protein n=1 Tax=Crocosphaera chwakensis CCY0110 TaxID=391612 RepID=A3IWG8_9CHRO|nr:hypothetical protein [Crocosphaera chwakensis]EAZ89152.1 hypothetical protein CY0110_31660 [Crocosphaera chwakensis CCY0110]
MPKTRELSDKIPVGRLIVQKACLEVAMDRLNEIYEGNEIAASILLELQMAAKLAEVFNDTWSSIYWLEARKRTRDRVKMTLKDIAAKIIDHVEEAMTLFDELCDEQDANPTLDIRDGWIGFKAGLELLYFRDLKYHDEFVKENSIEYLPLIRLIEEDSTK